MTLVQLRYFLALVELRNFSRVAERFFVAQAAVSYQIRTLEQELGVRLFDRSTRSVRPTVAGQGLYRDVLPLMQGLDAAFEKAKTSSERPQFTLACSRVCFGERFNRMVDLLAKEHPHISILLERSEPEDDLIDLLTSGRADAALFFNPYPSLPVSLKTMTFGIYDQRLIVSEHHRLADRPVVSIQEIDQNEVLACEGMRRIERIRSSPMYEFDNQSILLRDLDSLLAMVRLGRGVACLPVIDDVNVTGLRYIQIDDPIHKNSGPTLTFAWRDDNASPVLHSAMQAAQVLFSGPPFS